MTPPSKQRPVPRPRVAKKPVMSSPERPPEAIYDDPTGSLSVVKPPPSPRANFHGNDYDDPDALYTSPPPPRSPVRPPDDGLYDDIQDVIGILIIPLNLLNYWI